MKTGELYIHTNSVQDGMIYYLVLGSATLCASESAPNQVGVTEVNGLTFDHHFEVLEYGSKATPKDFWIPEAVNFENLPLLSCKAYSKMVQYTHRVTNFGFLGTLADGTWRLAKEREPIANFGTCVQPKSPKVNAGSSRGKTKKYNEWLENQEITLFVMFHTVYGNKRMVMVLCLDDGNPTHIAMFRATELMVDPEKDVNLLQVCLLYPIATLATDVPGWVTFL